MAKGSEKRQVSFIEQQKYEVTFLGILNECEQYIIEQYGIGKMQEIKKAIMEHWELYHAFTYEEYKQYLGKIIVRDNGVENLLEKVKMTIGLMLEIRKKKGLDNFIKIVQGDLC